MSNAYSITESDVRGPLIDETSYDRLMTDPTTGTRLTDGQDVIDRACDEFASWLTGAFTSAANLALAKPQVLAVCVYGFHRRRAANGDYQVPEAVTTDYRSALAWAKETGRTLLAAEGATSPAGEPSAQYEVIAARFGRTKFDRL